MDNLETKIAEYKPSSLEVGMNVELDIAKSVLQFPIDYVAGFLPNEVRLKLFKGDEKRNKRSVSSNTITQLIAGFSAVIYGLVEQINYDKLYSNHFDIYAVGMVGIGLGEIFINSIRRKYNNMKNYNNKEGYNYGHPLFTVPYHFLKKRYSAQEQKLIDQEKQKTLTAQNQLLLEDKVGSLSHPTEIENQGMLSLPKYTSTINYNDEEHF